MRERFISPSIKWLSFHPEITWSGRAFALIESEGDAIAVVRVVVVADVAARVRIDEVVRIEDVRGAAPPIRRRAGARIRNKPGL